jgi:hypothetical protein
VDGERKAAGGVIRIGPSPPTGIGNREAYMQQKLHWLEHDSVALAVLVIGIGMVELLALLI